VMDPVKPVERSKESDLTKPISDDRIG